MMRRHSAVSPVPDPQHLGVIEAIADAERSDAADLGWSLNGDADVDAVERLIGHDSGD